MSKTVNPSRANNGASFKSVLMRSTLLAALPLCLADVALAQEAGEDDEAEEQVLTPEPTLESIEFDEYPLITVTGTNIRNATPTQNSTTYTAEDITRSGAVTLDDFLRQLPQNQTRRDPGVADFGGTGGGGTFGDRSGGVNLRGLGEQNTLILIDGRRIASSSSRPGAGAGGVRSVGVTADIEAIPLQAIDRIEIITDGASAIYGSDAIGGVVNIILKRDFEGGSITGRYGDSTSGGDDQSVQLTYGINRGAFRSLLTAGYTRERAVRVREASFVRPTSDFEDVGLIPPPAAFSSFPALAQIGTSICDNGMGGEEECDPTDPFSFFDEIRFGSLNIPTEGFQTVFASFPGGLGRFPTVADASLDIPRDEAFLPLALGPDLEQYSVSGTFSYEISSKTEIRASALYSHRESQGAFTPFEFSFLLNREHPFNPFTIANGAQFDEGIDALFNTAILADQGLVPRQEFNDDTDNYTFGLGVDHEFGVGDWELRLDYTYSGSEGSGQSLERDLAAQVAFGASPEFQTLNVFGPDGPDPALINALIRSAPRSSQNEFHIVNLAADGKLFTLPGGDLRIAVGGEYRSESFNFVNQARQDPNTGEINTPFCLSSAFACDFVDTNFDFGRDVYGGFIEANIPLIGRDMNVPLIDELIVSASTRYDRYEDADVRDRFSSAVGAIWRVNNNLSFRANWNESFRAPDIIQLGDPISIVQNDFVFDDPISPFGFAIIETAISGGNAALEDETAESFSAGGQLNFDVGAASFTFNVNYFNNIIRNQSSGQFSNPTRLFILGNPELFPDIVTRDINNPTVIERFVTAPFNAVSTQTEGMDFSARIAYDFENGHQIAALFNGVTHFKFETQDLPQIEPFDLLGRNDGVQDFTGNLELRYSTNNLTAGVTARYNSSYLYEAFNRNEFQFTDFEARDYLTFDLRVSYDFNETGDLLNGVRVAVTGTNIFEATPPLFGASPFGVGYFNGVDPRQRVVAFEVTKAF